MTPEFINENEFKRRRKKDLNVEGSKNISRELFQRLKVENDPEP
jgi:hypothetical protein